MHSSEKAQVTATTGGHSVMTKVCWTVKRWVIAWNQSLELSVPAQEEACARSTRAGKTLLMPSSHKPLPLRVGIRSWPNSVNFGGSQLQNCAGLSIQFWRMKLGRDSCYRNVWCFLKLSVMCYPCGRICCCPSLARYIATSLQSCPAHAALPLKEWQQVAGNQCGSIQASSGGVAGCCA
jgi:hypothetical protein